MRKGKSIYTLADAYDALYCAIKAKKMVSTQDIIGILESFHKPTKYNLKQYPKLSFNVTDPDGKTIKMVLFKDSSTEGLIALESNFIDGLEPGDTPREFGSPYNVDSILVIGKG